MGVEEKDIMNALGMQDEEVERLLETKGSPALLSGKNFSDAWVPSD